MPETAERLFDRAGISEDALDIVDTPTWMLRYVEMWFKIRRVLGSRVPPHETGEAWPCTHDGCHVVWYGLYFTG